MKNSQLKTNEFLEFVLKIIAKEYTGKSKRDLEAKVKDMLGTRKLVVAASFYNVLKLLNADVDVACDKLFKNHKFSLLDLLPESDNRLKDFLSIFIQETKDIASAAKIENTRLSRLLSGEFMHLYPDEVYGLAKSFGLNPSKLFNYFYGDGERPVVGV